MPLRMGRTQDLNPARRPAAVLFQAALLIACASGRRRCLAEPCLGRLPCPAKASRISTRYNLTVPLCGRRSPRRGGGRAAGRRRRTLWPRAQGRPARPGPRARSGSFGDRGRSSPTLCGPCPEPDSFMQSFMQNSFMHSFMNSFMHRQCAEAAQLSFMHFFHALFHAEPNARSPLFHTQIVWLKQPSLERTRPAPRQCAPTSKAGVHLCMPRVLPI